jgi:hypothetical protein
VTAWPMCNNPVGDGAMRPRYCFSVILGAVEESLT